MRWYSPQYHSLYDLYVIFPIGSSTDALLSDSTVLFSKDVNFTAYHYTTYSRYYFLGCTIYSPANDYALNSVL